MIKTSLSRRELLTKSALTAGLYATGCLSTENASAGPMPMLELQQSDFVHHVAFTLDGARFATTTYLLSPRIYLWDPATGVPVQEFPRRDMGCNDLQFSPDAQLLAVLGTVNPYYDLDVIGIQIFDLAQNNSSFDLGRRAVSYKIITFSPDSKLLAAVIDRVGPDAAGIEVWEIASRHLLFTIPLEEFEFLSQLLFSADGAQLTGYSGGRTATWDLRTKSRAEERFKTEEELYNIVFSQNATRCLNHINAFTDASYDREKEYQKIRVYDTTDYHLIWKLDGLPIRSLREFAFSQDGDLLAISCHATPLAQGHLFSEYPRDVGYEVHVYSMITGEEVFRLPDNTLRAGGTPLPTKPNEVVNLKFSPDGTQLAIFGWGKIAQLWRLPT